MPDPESKCLNTVEYFNDNGRSMYRLTNDKALEFFTSDGAWIKSRCSPNAPKLFNWPRLTEAEAREKFPQAFLC